MTVRSLLWDVIAFSAGSLVILLGAGGVAFACACIGTETKPELRPVLATRKWLAARQAAAMAWWHAHRWSVAGLLYPHRGRHLGKETGDGGQGGTTRPVPVVRPQERAGERVGAEAPDGRGLVDTVPAVRRGSAEEPVQRPAAHAQEAADPGDLTREHMDDWAAGRFTHHGEDDDTLTERIFADVNAEHLVTAHEPPAPGSGAGEDPGPDGQTAPPPPGATAGESSGPGYLLRCPVDEAAGDFPGHARYERLACEPEDPPGPVSPEQPTAVNPAQPGQSASVAGSGAFNRAGCGYIDGCRDHALCWDQQRCADFTDPPGPDRAGGPSSGTPFAPVTTAASGRGIPVKADSTGPGTTTAQQPSMKSGEPGAQAAASRPFRRLPAADLTLPQVIAGYFDAVEGLLPVWEDALAEHMRRTLTAGAA